jgi:membrane-associated protease RseP (regulator of RpoE activity)
MVSINGFLFYDLVFLVVFTLWVVWFLYTRKSNLKREGIIYLYRTSLGIKFIDYVGKKYRKLIGVSQYVAVTLGFALMGAILFLLSFTLYTYVKFPQITQVVKAPPLLPLIPYFPALFGLESFFPPLYFTYWIVAILIVAVVHEFSHGIFAKFHGLNIKSTGFAFLGPILGAFVEPDETEMLKKGKFAQMSILSAGVFANIITTLIFFVLLWLTFSFAFVPAGVLIHSYPSGYIEVGNIQRVNDVLFYGEFDNLLDEETTVIDTEQGKYLVPTASLREQLEIIGEDLETSRINVFLDAPAIRNEVVGAISGIDGVEIKSLEDLDSALGSKSPGDVVNVETITSEGNENYEVTLDAHPTNPERAFLGINLNSGPTEGFRGFISNTLFFKDSALHYEELNKPLVFFYYLFWWIVIINFFVALFNMLPVGILDGGRFFYLTILGITGSEKATKIVYKILFYSIMLIFFGLMFSWLIAL